MFNVRQRTGYLFLTLILGHVILISAQVSMASGTRVLEAVTFGVFSEIQRTISSMFGGVKYVWEGYVELWGVRVEKPCVCGSGSRRWRCSCRSSARWPSGTRSLQAVLDLRNEAAVPTMSARVIAADATPWFRTLTIDRGSRDGLRRDLAVIAATGVVGRVVGQPGARAAKIQLLIDRNAAAGAMIERTRARGVVMGSDESSLQMEYVSNLEDVQIGEVVVTSGIDGIYPKGFVIGHVEVDRARPRLGTRLSAWPRSSTSPDLEHVLVVMAEPPPSPTAAGTE